MLIFQLPGLLLPGIAIRLDLVALRFEVSEGFFQGCGKLLLGVEMLLDSTNAGLLILDNLRVRQVFASVARTGRGDAASAVRGGSDYPIRESANSLTNKFVIC